MKPRPNPNLLGIILFLSSLICAANSDLASDRAVLLALRDTVHGEPLLWNTTTSPCEWVGVTCVENRVVELRLPGRGLSGQLPSGIGNLTSLQTLSLRFNALTGTIPADFANLAALRNLYFQGNQLSGEIPEFLFTLPNLIRLNLAHNNFSGKIPASVNKLKRLATLYLEENQLSGSIAEIDIPSLQQINVSNNDLTGSIPGKLSGMPASAFLGNSLCGKPLNCCSANDCNPAAKKKLSGGAIAGIVIACVVALLLILVLLLCLCRKRRGKTTETRDVAPTTKQTELEIPPEKAVVETDDSNTKGAGFLGAARGGDSKSNAGNNKSLIFFGKAARVFNLEDLLRASAEVLGKGTFGTAYKATLETGVVVAVKRLRDVLVPEKEFREKMEVIGSMDHECLVPLRAYYYSRDEKLLVYDYMPMGSLSALLHGNRGGGRTPLNWDTRANIALGAAKGITYLHSQGPTISHGNIKSSNILLTTSFEARVSDFGLAQLGGPTATPNRVDGYRAPEVTDSHKVSQKADVYSFGVFLLELLTGKAPTHSLLNEEGVDLPRWVQSIVREEWTSEVFDLELLRYQNVEEDMVQLLQLAINCTAQYPDKRPSMAEVTSQIEELCRASSSQHESLDDGSSQQS